MASRGTVTGSSGRTTSTARLWAASTPPPASPTTRAAVSCGPLACTADVVHATVDEVSSSGTDPVLADVAGTDTAGDAGYLLIADMSGGSAMTMHLAKGEVQRQPPAISRTFTVGTLRKPHLDAGSASLTGGAVNPKA